MARILIVDDAEQNLLLYQLYLKGDEFDVATARSGREALTLVAEEEFDLILLDVVMPEMGGIEVCRRLKATPRTASIPVIFFTGRLRDDADKQVAYEAGAVDYLTKPVEKQELIARIRVMLRFRHERALLERKNDGLAEAVRRGTALIAGVAAQLEDYKAIVDAERSVEATLLLSPDGEVQGFSAAAPELFPGLAVGDQVVGAEGPLGGLAELVLGDVVAGEDTVELASGRTLGVTMQPMPTQQLVLKVRDVTERERIDQRIADREPENLAQRIQDIATDGRGSYRISKFIGESPVLRELTENVDRLRQSRCTALIVGETGSGKELIASALHYDGPHGSRPFTPIHCGAISPDLIEAELFGHEKGAFTGATSSKDGLFAACDGGTIFLDEIAETSMDLQVKLLRVLQLGEIRPVGATKPSHVDVRIIAATNRDLAEMVKEGKFREDLYYRLDVVTLYLPPLRERKEDIPRLLNHFIERLNTVFGRGDSPVTGVSQGALRALMQYDWPGNVRELENVLERAFALGVGTMLNVEDLPPRFRGGIVLESAAKTVVVPPPPEAQSLREQKRGYEKQMFLETLQECHWNKAEACKRLGMAKSTFYRKLKELNLGD